ncbi:Linoleate 13S-lipoxygenase 2-1 [Morus notabilis]|uniref:Lipoxygenase n=1 Tax=Morus notabilis TaxID=981085 RepID=W9R031_9ROSA|nr:Linoleate 13S-lipoxygenase 2-1 [Morus notabilis]
MLKPQLVHQSKTGQTLVPFPKPFVHGTGLPVFIRSSEICLKNKQKNVHLAGGGVSGNVKAVLRGSESKKAIKVKAVATVSPTVGGFLTNLGLDRGLDDIQDLLGKSLLVELVSAELDPKTGLEKETIKDYARRLGRDNNGGVLYEAEFEVPKDFGRIGGILVENEHHKEMFLKDIAVDGFPTGPVNSYLPSETPSGLKRLREEELVSLRGNGEGERKKFERIYDYDVYNDLGDPDKNADLKRPVLGGKDHPYPRRCRTGRRRTKTDPLSEARSGSVYVPRDEAFSEVKQLTFQAKTVYSGLHALVPSLQTAFVNRKLGFPYFTAIDTLFDQGLKMPSDGPGILKNVLPRLIKAASDADDILQFEVPETMLRDKFFWFRDEEFARQTLAGLNPYSIQLVTEWPLKSKLDPAIYGPPESAITTELIEQEIRGFVTVEEAIKRKRLFILDYHDLLLPYVNKVREIEGTTLYGSRTIFFLTRDGTLRPLAIELTRPPVDGKPQWKEVFTPCWDATGLWLWRLAKAHVLSHDSGFHQLVSHWLRTHCATEPYIIATNRQLSAMHPIYRLLHPHFRYTMEINALAREALINAGGIIESSFSPAKYAMELCSDGYDKLWRFDREALPADLISRGMAVEDPSAPHGVRLTIEDYPFAADGLVLWDIIKEWVTNYVNYYYSDASKIESDEELQAWWTEIRTVGHADKKDESWWPVLKTPKDLIEIITTITWVTSGHHAAVNFGQYTYAGYFPNRPTVARLKMPTEDADEVFWKKFMEKPEFALLQCFPSQIQATTVMAVLDILSNHSPDEEYLGEELEPSWEEEPAIKAAFERFNGRVMSTLFRDGGILFWDGSDRP